ncbi:hypothetical protein [Vibrio sp. SCSIO 43137]|uniref:hypothetical protein n=1 Tax=Vibrio sp. SCSIO 43137 TaxID=3021011 RepID=UPI002306FE91|nr:hypothetical protein [Vibrio sp. SCSIO 43137]WCE28320.1 hypothetical protein PK654_07965 [Vibrio sp. SCSIO 43137]
MKASELMAFLSDIDGDKEIVTGESWLPEQLINAEFDGELINLEFDNAPEDDAGDTEGRGFVEHEVNMLRDKIVQLLFDDTMPAKVKTDVFLKLFLMIHEKSSSEVVEILEESSPLHSREIPLQSEVK